MSDEPHCTGLMRDLYETIRWKLGLARRRWMRGRSSPDPSDLTFACIVCGTRVAASREQLTRDAISCFHCGSSVRHRAVIRALLVGLKEEVRPVSELPPRPARGIGISDSRCYSRALARAFDYRNTYLHRAPRLDLVQPDGEIAGSADFLIASDVLEHVAPPVSRAFAGAFEILRPGGVCVLSVPIGSEAKEHFPDLHAWAVRKRAGRRVLVNRDRSGQVREYHDLVFHGGAGDTLELRLFSREWLLAELADAGFEGGRFVDEPCERFGIIWGDDPSTPVLAFKPR